MHAHQTSFAKCRYQSRALSASPSPPPIPPQPDFFEYKQSLPSFTVVVPPPPRCYQLVPIRDSLSNQQISQQSPKIESHIHTSAGRRSFNRNNYENIHQGTIKPTVVVKDPRRKPYYYNELNQSLDIDLNEQNSSAKSNSTTRYESEGHILNDEIKQNPTIGRNSETNYGSGGSLDHVF